MGNTPVFGAGVDSATFQILAASSTGDKEVLVGYGSGLIIGRITVTTNNTGGPRVVSVKRQKGASVQVGTFSLPDGAGFSAGVSPVDVIQQVFADIPINLATDESLIFTLDAALTTAKQLDVHIEYAPI